MVELEHKMVELENKIVELEYKMVELEHYYVFRILLNLNNHSRAENLFLKGTYCQPSFPVNVHRK